MPDFKLAHAILLFCILFESLVAQQIVPAQLCTDMYWVYPDPVGSSIFDVCMIDSRIGILVGIGGSIARTTDAWKTSTHAALCGCDSLLGVASRMGGLVVAVGIEGTIIKSSDFGATWYSVVTQYSEDLHDVAMLDDGRILICGEDGLLIESQDLGATWSELKSGTTMDLRSFYFFNENLGFCVGGDTNDHVLALTNDGGSTWKNLFSGYGYTGSINSVGAFSTATFIVATSRGWYLTSDSGNSWVYHPENKNHDNVVCFSQFDALMTIDNELFRTTDGGMTWEKETFSDNRTIYSCYDAKESDSAIFFVGSHGLFYSFSKTDKSYSRIDNSKGNTAAISAYGGTVIVTISAYSSSQVLYSHDYGQSWNISANSGINFEPHIIYPIDKNIIYLSSGVKLFKSIDGGVNWQLDYDQFSDAIAALSFSDNDHGVIASGGRLFRTTNAGTRWVDVAEMRNASVVRYIGPDTLLSLKNDRSIWLSVDNGINWARINEITEPGAILAIFNESSWLLQGQSYFAFTKDAGITYTHISHTLAKQLSGAVKSSNGEMMAYGASGTIVRINDSVAELIHRLAPESNINGAVSLEDGSFIFTTHLDGIIKVGHTSPTHVSAVSDKVIERYSVYPTFSNGLVTIRSHIGSASGFVVKLYDMLGRKALEIASEGRNYTQHTTSIDLSDRNMGAYWVVVEDRFGVNVFPIFLLSKY